LAGGLHGLLLLGINLGLRVPRPKDLPQDLQKEEKREQIKGISPSIYRKL